MAILTRFSRRLVHRSASVRSSRTSRRDAHADMDPSIVKAARHSDEPDPDTYDRPATTRITQGNLGLSIVLVAVVGILALVLLLTVI